MDFDLRQGEIHAVVGKNGAGKSTLISIISGTLFPDKGSIEFEGHPVGFNELGNLPVATVHQEIAAFPNLTVAQNIFAGNEPRTRWGGVDRYEEHSRATRLIRTFGLSVEPGDAVAILSPVEQKIVAIMRAFEKSSRILILDEPTAVLSLAETERMFELLAQVRANNLSIIYISHRLEEIFQIADRVTVLRDGRAVHVSDLKSIDLRQLVTEIVGDAAERRSQDGMPGADRAPEFSASAPRFEARSITHAGGRFSAISIVVRRGEILGMAGLVGAGKTEFGKAVFGIEKLLSGEFLLDGSSVEIASPADAIRRGVIYVTEDRKREGLFSDMTIANNVCAPILDQLENRFHVLSEKVMNDRARQALEGYHLKATGVDQIVATLSGGNQQKVLLARWLQLKPKVLIVDEPTIGVDVSAREEIYRLLRRIAYSGTAVIFISCEFKELLQNTDRIVTIYKGRITGSYTAADTTEQQLLEAASGLVHQ